MESSGQFLLYDAFLALFIIFIVLVCMIFVLGGQDDTSGDSNVALERLVLLDSFEVHGENLLVALSKGDEVARGVVCDVLSDDSFVLRDVTLNRVLVERNSGGDVASGARKVVGSHLFELIIFY